MEKIVKKKEELLYLLFFLGIYGFFAFIDNFLDLLSFFNDFMYIWNVFAAHTMISSTFSLFLTDSIESMEFLVCFLLFLLIYPFLIPYVWEITKTKSVEVVIS